ncbi:MAG TPA: hypothetical protein VKD72_27905 [Gemmataceae bacterium]|nr:hypothetical protein [Gemmataceae bacterium]
MTHGPDHSPLPWRLESRELGTGKALLVLAANGDLVAYTSHAGHTVSYLTEEGRHITRTPEQTEGNYALLVRAVNASKTLVDACADVAAQLRQSAESLRREGQTDAAEGIANLAGALQVALDKIAGVSAEPAALPVEERPAQAWVKATAVPPGPAVIVSAAPGPPDAPSQG